MPKAVILGGVSWNQMILLPRLPDGTPGTVFASKSWEAVGSSGAGKALNLAALGWDVTLWALLGDDEYGHRVREDLAGRGVRLLTELDPAGTMRHVNLMDPNGDRLSIFANPGTLDRRVDPAFVVPLVEAADFVAVTIFEHCRVLLAPLLDAGVELWVDIHDYDDVNPYHADFIDAAAVLQVSSVQLPHWRRFAESRLAAPACRTTMVIVTHGAAGASVLTADGWVEVAPVAADHVVDTNGAGDAFCAGVSTARQRGASVAEQGAAGARMAAAAIASFELAPVAVPRDLVAR